MASSVPIGTPVRIEKDIYDHKRGQRFLVARAGEDGVVTSLGTRYSPLWQRVRLASGKKVIVDFEDREAIPVRKNHHIRLGGEFYTPGGRKGTVLGKSKSGFYPVRWKDGTFGRVRDTEQDAYPTEGSRTKRKNPRWHQPGPDYYISSGQWVKSGKSRYRHASGAEVVKTPAGWKLVGIGGRDEGDVYGSMSAAASRVEYILKRER